jgi:RsiW-degrading membrane proteinase PrsW (M82 family)
MFCQNSFKKMKLKYRFLLASESHFESRQRFVLFWVLAGYYLLGVILNTVYNNLLTLVVLVIVTVLYVTYVLLSMLHDDLRFEIIHATNDEEAYIRSLLKR